MNGVGPRGEPRIRVIAPPASTNPGGTIFGGWLMGQMDVAASVPALDRARGPVVTASVEALHFRRPLRAGDEVSIHAELLTERRSSLRIGLTAWRRRPGRGQDPEPVADGVMVFVAVDEAGRPRPLPPAEQQQDH